MELLKIFLNNSISFILILSIIVFIHEFGHYIVAKLNGVKIENFSIGFGKEIFGRNDKSGTRWSLSCIPFGGYVKFFGDEDASSSVINKEKLTKLTEKEKNGCLYYKSAFVRLLVAFAGPFFNFLSAFLIFLFIFTVYGLTFTKPIITTILPNSIAEKSDLRINDQILEINGKKISSFEDVQMQIILDINKNMELKINRNGETIIKNIKPELVEKEDILKKKTKMPQLGIGSNVFEHKKISFIQAGVESVKRIYTLCSTTLVALGQMITRQRGLEGLGGPIKIAQYSGAIVKNGFEAIVSFIALISVSLGLMNLLPIPALDGGHIVLCLIEIIRRKPLNEKVENIMSYMGFGILICLMIFSTIKDLIDVIFK